MTRRTRPVWIYALGAVVVAGAFYLVFELGRYRGGYSVLDHRRDRAELSTRLAEQQAATDELRRQLAIVETSSEIDRVTYDEIRASLGALEAEIQAQQEELVFYRGIVSPQDGVAGLRIESLEVLPSDGEGRHSLRLLLVQSIVHTRRLAGTVKLQLEGMQSGQTASYEAAELAAPGEPYDMTYEFRYFQGLEAELELPSGFEPQRVIVEVFPSDARAERINAIFDWPEEAH